MSELFDLSGKVAIVTGAAGLIGREHCRALAMAGAHVVATDISDPIVSIADELTAEFDRKMLGRAVDITDEASVEALAAEVQREFGRTDILVNNAALNEKVEDPKHGAEETAFENYDIDLFRKALEVNVTGALICAKRFGTRMAEQGSGSIINVSSTYGLVAPDQSLYLTPEGKQPFYKSPAYPATKAALLGMTKHLASYWGPKGVRVNALCPGGVGTDGTAEYFRERYASRTMVGRMATERDYRGAVVFLASEASAYMTGATLVVDGGWTAW